MSKTRRASEARGREGVAAVELIVNSELNWICREQVTDDYGIDAQIEVVEGRRVTGKLIAVQIKSGESYFKTTEGGWWFYVDADDVTYWTEHALPVIVVLVNPATHEAFWEAVNESTLRETAGGGKKVLIPSAKRLGSRSRTKLARLAEGKPYELRVRRLRLSASLMRLLASGERRLLVEIDEWVNKMSGRGDIKFVSVDGDNQDRLELETGVLFGDIRPYRELLPEVFPWADLEVHEETYSEMGLDEGDPADAFGFAGSGLRPYGNSYDEVDHWRLELRLNELGWAFLRVDDYARQATTTPRSSSTTAV
jgi:hypothetical protein